MRTPTITYSRCTCELQNRCAEPKWTGNRDGADSLYASAVLDVYGEVIFKLVNAGSRSEKVMSSVIEAAACLGSCTYLQSDDWKSQEYTGQEAIVPRIRPVAAPAPEPELLSLFVRVYCRISTQSK